MQQPIITKKYFFCASHKYGNANWTDEENYRVFDKDYNNHGHNYILEVSIKGDINPDTGWLTDLGTLNNIVKNNIINIIDHSQIEVDIPWFKNKQPSSENMLIWAWEIIEPKIKEGLLFRIRLVETHSIYTDYFGPQ